jgi:uncharacterized protein (TIGR02118 family)
MSSICRQSVVNLWRVIMYRVSILFVQPIDPAEFERYYHDTHFPLAAQLNGIKGLTIGKCEAMDSQQAPAFYRVTSFYFESRIALEALLTSTEGHAALADLPKFATGATPS